MADEEPPPLDVRVSPAKKKKKKKKIRKVIRRNEEVSDDEEDKVVIKTSVDLAKQVKDEGTITLELRVLLDEESSDEEEFIYEDEETEEERREREAEEKEEAELLERQRAKEAEAEAIKAALEKVRLEQEIQERVLGGEGAVGGEVDVGEGENGEELREEKEEEEEEEDHYGFGYKEIERKKVPVPKNYMELQIAFANAWPRHNKSLICERPNGRTVNPKETNFKRDEVIVFREFMPELRMDKVHKKIQGLRKGWEEDVYQPQLKNFKINTWTL